MRRIARAGLALALVAGCAAGGGGGAVAPAAKTAKPKPPAAGAPAADSVTIALWHLDETGGARVFDAGPFRLEGSAGIDTRTDFGRFRAARVLQRGNDSFLFVPYNPALEPGGPFTVEAWIHVASNTNYELQVIAARWTPVPNGQGWVLGVTGLGMPYPIVNPPSPGWFNDLVSGTTSMHLLFGYTPAGAGAARGYASTTQLPIGRWTHVAASVNGDVVALYIDGRLDAQYLSRTGMRPCESPLVIGNALDPRRLTNFGGDLRIDPSSGTTLTYGFDGEIDEVRLSRAARTTFDSVSR